MIRVWLVALALGMGLVWGGFPVATAQPPGGGTPFDRFDANKDGKLSRDEIPPRLRDRFDQIDANHDGFVSREEERAFLAQARGRPGGRQARPRLPDSIQIERDLNYAGTTNPAQTLDLLRPKKSRGNRPLPLVVNIHGGAFKAGDKSMGVGELIALVSSGEYVGASINYRLSGEARWPAQIHDCKAAIRWLRANAARYQIDPERIGVIGGSAGGHLVAMLGLTAHEKGLEGEVGGNLDQSSAVQCVVDEFGPSELLVMSDYPSRIDHNAADSPESELIGGPLRENRDKARAASPITYVSRDAPPFLIIHGTDDPLVPFNQSERLAAALRKAGADCRLIKVVGAGHGGFRAPEIPKRVRQFFDRHLRNQPVGPISDEPVENHPEP